eukprot:CAMPEP_0113895596 /NCGR_PEP_ID=MMETSP0780_2-20120614/17465_1 /TAXON_ID=652834 /ORGANISM="Palpitomonas bilix" /LENGTH=50 /DNA_ID=CAMNT_0000886473 /DNA_START=450 /DNA_END=602 /DNA_ORIENTATION=- /assembly_acc=CAM_ASM_000599
MDFNAMSHSDEGSNYVDPCCLSGSEGDNEDRHYGREGRGEECNNGHDGNQ